MTTPPKQALDLIIKGCEAMGRKKDRKHEVQDEFRSGYFDCCYEAEYTLEDLLAVMKNKYELPIWEDFIEVCDQFDFTKSLQQNLERQDDKTGSYPFAEFVLKILT